jgi:hypothetical protein
MAREYSGGQCQWAGSVRLEAARLVLAPVVQDSVKLREFAMRTLLVLSILCVFCPLASHAQDSKASPAPGHKTTTEEAVVQIS